MRLELDIPDNKLAAARGALAMKKITGSLDPDHDPLDWLLVYIIGYVIKKQKENKNDLSKNP